MRQLQKIIKDELAGWKVWEIVWLLLSSVTILCLSIYWKDSVIGIISAVSGVMCVVCTGKGKLSAYVFGLINTVLYAYIAFTARYYGEVMLNILYYLPMQFYGFYVWNKNIDETTHEVKKRKMRPKHLVLLLVVILMATVLYGLMLKLINGAMPFVDALSTVVSVVAMIVSIKMYAEQWLLWIIVDTVTVILWGVAFVNGQDNAATLMMWLVYLINAVVMQIKWMKEAVTTHV